MDLQPEITLVSVIRVENEFKEQIKPVKRWGTSIIPTASSVVVVEEL